MEKPEGMNDTQDFASQEMNVNTPVTGGVGPEQAADMQDLLREVELEASLRFGSREMTLAEILNLGPGDVIELDRQIQDPVELLIGDKIVARGTAVITAGVYALKITQVSEVRKALESVRCLF